MALIMHNIVNHIAALQICQNGNLEKLQQHVCELLHYRHRVCKEVDQMQSQMMERLRIRNSTFPTVGDLLCNFSRREEYA
jgi:hypothetical protein